MAHRRIRWDLVAALVVGLMVADVSLWFQTAPPDVNARENAAIVVPLEDPPLVAPPPGGWE